MSTHPQLCCHKHYYHCPTNSTNSQYTLVTAGLVTTAHGPWHGAIKTLPTNINREKRMPIHPRTTSTYVMVYPGSACT
eukprot:1157757-Pelagomonas_calceolata.AAC.26